MDQTGGDTGILHVTLLLLPGPQKWQLGFGLFVSYCSYFSPTAYGCSYFQSLTVSLYSVAGGYICPGASTPVKGPRSQVPGPHLSQNRSIY